MNLTTIKQLFIPDNLRNMVSIQRDMLLDVQISDEQLGQIAGLLRYQPEEWLYLHVGHPLRKRAEAGIKTIIPYLPTDAVILVHASARWCLVAFDDVVYPAIFRSTPQDTALYKIVMGKAVHWLTGLRDDVAKILANSQFLDGDEAPELAFPATVNDPVARLTGAGLKGF